MFAAALVAPSTAGAATQLSYPSFADVSALQLNGNAYQKGTTVQLTDASSYEAGSVYTRSPVDVSGSWSVAYHLLFTWPGMADGAAFVIQPVSSTALAPSTGPFGGSGHGYQGVTPYVALDIDAYRNSAGIVSGSEAPYDGVRAPLPAHTDATDWYVWADYDASAGTLSMYVSTSPAKPAAPLVTRNGVDLASILGTTQAYAGFAGATGSLVMGIDVASWFFEQTAPAETSISVTGDPIAATEGEQFSGTVATVTGDPDSPPSDYTAQIDWGDGTTSAGTVDASGDVSGSHTYAEDGDYTVTTTVIDGDNTSSTASATSAATVSDATLTADQLDVSGGTEGSQATNVSFAFTDANSGAPSSDFAATINWGDGTTTGNALVSGGDGFYSVAGSHTYTEEGSYPVTVTVNDEGGQSTSADGSAGVEDAALSASGTSASSQPDFSGTVASFTDANIAASPADFSATIDWGDGTTSHAQVSADASGGFDVSGSHTYGQTGPHTVGVSIADAGGASASATSTVLVYELATSNGSFVVGDGSTAIGSSVDFWGSQWAAENPMSSGSAPSSFKGFAAHASTDPPVCGSTFTATPGPSGQPPAALPAYMGVYVTAAVTKDGRDIAGDIDHIVIVKTDSSYRPDPGHAGVGQVVAGVC